MKLDWWHMGIANIYMVYLLNVFSADLSMLKLYRWRTGIEDIHMVFLLNAFSCVFLNYLLD